ncbi:Peptidase family M48 [Hyella patelloides LEGE 07179]|uniref:Peptidase family M48 n=1 Tax=Hyella patelloides LEGE 07179 TaxID=945734 RepID=A0A563VRR8_9CYAN|nr:M48 family metallopeptidase [Hyella patelloides]VEP14072.1 Peptidase family M48 [Hyella patelloides LEGE 07179]
MVYKPKEIPEDVNVTPIHPLVNFANLLGTVVVFSAMVYLGLGVVATQLVTRISPEMEMKIGKQLLSSVKTTSTESQSEKLQYLENLLTSLQAPDFNTAIPLTIHIQKSEIANAAIIPGGHILVTTALLEEAESENELAFVLAHELGHHVARDPLKGFGRSLVFLTVASALGMGTGNADIVTLTGSLTNLHYSRQQESAADVYALEAIVRLYGHGDSSLDFFERIKTKDKRSKLSSYFSTHPLTQERVIYLRQVATEKGWQMRGEVTDLPDRVFD